MKLEKFFQTRVGDGGDGGGGDDGGEGGGEEGEGEGGGGAVGEGGGLGDLGQKSSFREGPHAPLRTSQKRILVVSGLKV